ncbi:putative bifunctional diguanylate cyclase/phosphodiesterase [Desulfotignum phosphitoxidans]|uniref:Signal transduction family protein n=1 Tax=Desulfotignum phosphitoxidans DSM 13687 TaxID=1286635 RepID=S0G2R7_9BACT|nr:GGDEF domain-containing phosphodiesterase [Desulfotignum phosphitoxidans]EMS81648.1 signal transduction family protein [Desulfotignum phosphitoxidans DSM 13687]
MNSLKTVKNIRLRYILALSAIGLLVTASFIAMNNVISKQRGFSSLVNLAGHQSGLVNRIAYFSSLMVSTDDETEFNMARAQLGKTIHKMQGAHHVLRHGSREKGIPKVTNERLKIIFDDPSVGLDLALSRFLHHAGDIYLSGHDVLNSKFFSYIYLTTYGPHVLEPMLDAAVDEYQKIGRAAIVKIERLETMIWGATILILLLEAGLIFYPLERHVRATINSLQTSVRSLTHIRKRLTAAQKLARVGDWEYRFSDRRLTWSDQTYDICGVDRKQFEVNEESALQLVHPDDRPAVKAALKGVVDQIKSATMEYRIICPNGQERMIFQQATVRKHDGRQVLSGTVQDITDRKKSESQIRKLALYDALTGLVNRRLLGDRLGQAIAASRRSRKYGAVLMLDLDNFKTLNDTSGHDIGDALLVEVAQRLNACIRQTDTAARLGGDEFVVLLEWLDGNHDTSLKMALDVAEKIRISLNRPYVLGKKNHMCHASASIGTVIFKGDVHTSSELLKRADVAMYEAKDLGRNRVCLFSKKRQAIVDRTTAMAYDLKKALARNEFSLYLQPQIMGTGNVCSAEALLRWIPAGKQPVSPGLFIPIAEETGLILPLGEWVLTNACQLLVKLQECRNLPTGFTLAVNISARQFSDDHFLEKVKAIISSSGIDPRRLKFELTETCLLHDLDSGRATLESLQQMGIHIELDDFGTGYSSLNMLKNLPINTLKIDQSLIHGIETGSQGKTLVRAAIAMARAMSMTVIAEGVETERQESFLVEEGCDIMQGFRYARPMPLPDFTAYLNENTRPGSKGEKPRLIVLEARNHG